MAKPHASHSLTTSNYFSMNPPRPREERSFQQATNESSAPFRTRTPFAPRIFSAIAGIQGEITTQYVLRYTPDFDPEGKPKVYRKITVDIPGLPNVKIRAREGYYPEEVPLGPATTAKGPSGAK